MKDYTKRKGVVEIGYRLNKMIQILYMDFSYKKGKIIENTYFTLSVYM
jgi:hypothetical protein